MFLPSYLVALMAESLCWHLASKHVLATGKGGGTREEQQDWGRACLWEKQRRCRWAEAGGGGFWKSPQVTAGGPVGTGQPAGCGGGSALR